MTWLQRITALLRLRPQQSRFWVAPRQGGVLVTPDSALASSAVSACVRIIAEALASLPWHVYRKADTGREPVPTHPAQWLLNVQPNPEQTAFAFKRQMLSHLLLWGNGYAEIERGGDGRPIWLWPLPPDRVTLRRNDEGELVVRVAAEGQYYQLPRENVLHLADTSFDGLAGVSRIELARRAIGAGIAQDVFTSAYYQNGAAVGGVIENEGRQLSPDAVKALLTSFNAAYAGPERAAKTLYVDAGLKYKPLALPLADAQFLETRRFQVEEVARWFGVPMHLLQDLSEANYAISYEASKNFIEHTLRPIAALLEQEANIRLFGRRAQGALYSRINLSGLMRADPKTRGEYYRAMVNAGVMSINEIRELEELNSIGADGDAHYLQVNMTTVERIREGAAAPAAASAPAEPAMEHDDRPAMNMPRPQNLIRREALDWYRQQKRQTHG